MVLLGGKETFDAELGGAMAELYYSREPGRARPGEAVIVGTWTRKRRSRQWNWEALRPFRWVRFEKQRSQRHGFSGMKEIWDFMELERNVSIDILGANSGVCNGEDFLWSDFRDGKDRRVVARHLRCVFT